MTYSIKKSDQDHKDLIHNFNKELKNNGIAFRLPPPDNENSEADNFIFKNNFILIENETIVRAGYTLKCQWFKINNELLQIGYYYNPITAGLFNKKYNICALLLLNDAQKKYENLFCLGMGGYSKALPKLLKGLNWNLKMVPFFFKVCNPNSFLKNIKYSKNSKLKYFINTLIVNSGLGWFGIKIFFLVLSLFHIKLKNKPYLDVKEIDTFDESLDVIWENAEKYSSFIAVRNSKYLKMLYSDKKFIKLKFFHNNKIVGWSISLCTDLEKHKQFGQMKLGSIVDCLSLKGYETSIVQKTSKMLKDKKVDLIVSNQSHIFWRKAFKKNSFFRGPSNFVFASSKKLTNKLMIDATWKDYTHLTRGDGDGPINL